ncbi:MAG: hypothetical protein ACK4VZ_01705 [Paracoccaceae bacterium]
MTKVTKNIRALLVVSMVGLAATQAHADLLNSESNILLMSVTGADNTLFISQDYLSPTQAQPNRINVGIIGDRNGGHTPWRSRLTSSLGLEPGSLVQSGWGHTIDLQVVGSDNVFAVSQIGSSNQVAGTIIGHANQTAIQQTGAGNSVSFSQSGQHNTIRVSQTSH